jgi:hypothetical protein
MPERQKHRVAVAVFLEVDGFDEDDAGMGGMLAVRQALGAIRGLPQEITFRAANGEHAAQVVEVMELGIAAGNGYLWTRPTGKAFQ